MASFDSSGSRAPKPKYGSSATAFAPQLTGSQTTAAYKARLTAAFAPIAYAKAQAAQGAPKATFDANNLPVDAGYDQSIAGLQKRREETLAGLTAKRTGGLLDTGYSASYDAAGNAIGLQYDPNNPYSQAALARLHYQQAKTGTDNSLAARGQFSSGARVNAQNANDQGFATNEDQRQKALLRFLAGIQSATTGAQTDYELNASQAYADRLARARQAFYDSQGG